MTPPPPNDDPPAAAVPEPLPAARERVRRPWGPGASCVLLGLALVFALWVGGGQGAERLLNANTRVWDAVRLAPTFSLVHGYALYYGPEAGPVTTAIYPPFAAVAYLPCVGLTNPTAVLFAASALAFAYYLAPVLALAWGAARGPRGGWWLAGGLLALALVQTAASTGLAYSAFGVHADAPALGLSGLGVLALTGVRRRGASWALLGAAVLLALGGLSKQTFVPVVPACVLAVAWRQGWRQAAWTLGAVVVVLAAAFAALIPWVDPRRMMFNIFTVPTRHPWLWGDDVSPMGKVWRFYELTHFLVREQWPVIAAGLAAACLRPPGPRREAGGEALPSLSAPGVLGLCGLLLLPTTLLGMIKRGGDFNDQSPTVYFLMLAALAYLRATAAEDAPGTTVAERTSPAARRLALAAGLAVFAFVVGPPSRAGLAAAWERARTVDRFPNATGFAYARAHPGTVYYPWNPLLTLMAEGRLYHFSYGLLDRELAGTEFRVTPEHFRQDTPGDLRYVAYPTMTPIPGKPEPDYVAAFLPEFTERVELPGLPGWTVFQRPTAPPPPVPQAPVPPPPAPEPAATPTPPPEPVPTPEPTTATPTPEPTPDA